MGGLNKLSKENKTLRIFCRSSIIIYITKKLHIPTYLDLCHSYFIIWCSCNSNPFWWNVRWGPLSLINNTVAHENTFFIS